MVAVIVILTVVVFIAVDITTRLVLRRLDAAKLRRERQEALDIGLRLEVSNEARSLKRVEVKSPRARILAVDDEPIVLDTFRKILVLDGYSVDTVETGQEALHLVQKNDYDFVFTDLKMPEYDGLEVTKAVKHLRPDVDVIMITGYGTIESAVDAMKYGAMDYVEKPFTEDELVDFVNKSLIRRQDRLEKLAPPRVHLVTATSPELASGRVFNVPAGVFISPSHVWVKIEVTGEVSLGVDDFARKTVGDVDHIVGPRLGSLVKAGEPLFTIEQAGRSLRFPSPVSGTVSKHNTDLMERPELLSVNPYEAGWVCRVDPTHLRDDLRALRIGVDAVTWYETEISRLGELLKGLAAKGVLEEAERAAVLSDEAWEAFDQAFMQVEGQAAQV